MPYTIEEDSVLTLASDTIAGTTFPKTKISFGTDGSYTDVSASTPLPVTLPTSISINGTPTVISNATITGTPTVIVTGMTSVQGTYGGTTTNAVPVYNAYLSAGEDLTIGVQKVEQRFSNANIGTAGTATVKGSSGDLDELIVAGGTLGPVTVYDSASGTSSMLLLPTVTPTQNSIPLKHCTFANGLVIVTGSATVLTLSYR